MLLLISDANILIDIEAGDLIAPMFNLGYQFSVPDVLFYEELEEQHSHFLDLGLQIHGLDEKGILRVQTLSQTYKNPSRNDLFALAVHRVVMIYIAGAVKNRWFFVHAVLGLCSCVKN